MLPAIAKKVYQGIQVIRKEPVLNTLKQLQKSQWLNHKQIVEDKKQPRSG